MALICDECGETSEDGEGWTAVLALMLLDGYEYKVKGPEGGRGLLPRCWSREFADSDS
jgi:hypothetical protein